MNKNSNNLKQLKKTIRNLVYEALANKFGQGGDVGAAEQTANSIWSGVYNVMIKGESNNEVFYRVTLHSSSGPIKYLKQDAQGRWFSMNPPQKIWTPAKTAQVATEPEQATAPVKECDCAPGCNCKGDAMQGDTTDVHTMDTANVDESINYVRNSTAVSSAYEEWTKHSSKYTKKPSAVSFVSGWNAALEHIKTTGLNEMTGTGAVAGYQTPYAFSKRGGSKKAMDATKSIGYTPAEKGY
jgi:hypothetical protein